MSLSERVSSSVRASTCLHRALIGSCPDKSLPFYSANLRFALRFGALQSLTALVATYGQASNGSSAVRTPKCPTHTELMRFDSSNRRLRLNLCTCRMPAVAADYYIFLTAKFNKLQSCARCTGPLASLTCVQAVCKGNSEIRKIQNFGLATAE